MRSDIVGSRVLFDRILQHEEDSNGFEWIRNPFTTSRYELINARFIICSVISIVRNFLFQFFSLFPASIMAITPSSIKLSYFDIEGVAEPVRLALTLAGIDFEDIRIKFPDWPELKAKTPYGQLPILELNGNGKLHTQSGAMLRFCGRLGDGGLYPSDKLLEIEEVIGLITDLNNALSPSLYIANRPQLYGYPEGSQTSEEGKMRTEALRTNFVKEILPKFLDYIQDLLDKSGDVWLVPGEHPTIADCFAVPYLRRFSRGYIDYIPATSLETHPRVVQYLERFCALPELQGRYHDGIGAAPSEKKEEE